MQRRKLFSHEAGSNRPKALLGAKRWNGVLRESYMLQCDGRIKVKQKGDELQISIFNDRKPSPSQSFVEYTTYQPVARP